MAALLDGSTVLLTGASSGIGRVMARLLGPRVGKLILVARRVDRLQSLETELRAENTALTVELRPCDLVDLAAVNKLLDDLAATDVDVLINNAGTGDLGVFDRADWKKTETMLHLNVTSLALLTHRLVAPMVARGRGGVLNISSGFGLVFSPGMAAYIGSKHFVTGFTESLRLDLLGTGVTVTQVCPGPVATEFEENVGNFTGLKPTLVEISAERCARAALRGFERGRAMVMPGVAIRFVMWLAALTPRWGLRLFWSPFARALRKKQLALPAPKP
jgi:uncharacterized protein